MCHNSIILSRFVDRDMLMRYHWGLGIGHAYSHTAFSTNSQPCSTPQQSRSNRDDTENYRLCCANDEGENLTFAGMQTEEDSELEFEPDDSESSIESQSDSESILGDHIDMYGPCGLDAMDEYYEF